MKKILAVIVMLCGICSVQADNLFQSSNPFPQTDPQRMNNIYESEPAKIQDETKKAKKSWFKKGENLKKETTEQKNQYKIPVYPVQNEGVQSNTNFYMFTTGQ